MQTVLVTGASGFIGRNLVAAGVPGARVCAVYRRGEDFPDYVRRRGAPGVEAVRCDLSSVADVRALARHLPDRVDAVVHLASNGDPALSVKDPRLDLLEGPGALVTLLMHVCCDRLVYFSSGAIYDGLQGMVGPETPVNPTLPYAIGKQAGEQYARFFRKSGRCERATILRFFGAFGPHEPARKIYTRLVRWATTPGDEPFEVRGDGKNLIDAMYVDDAIRGIHRVLASDVGDVTVDFANGAPVSIDELVETAAATLGKRGRRVQHVGVVPEYMEFTVSGEKMARLFGFRAEISLEDGLRRLARHLAETEQA